MFKKDASEASATQPRPQQTSGGRTPAPRRGGGQATIGASITVKGDVSGDEDLMIQGRVEGKIKLSKHNVTIGPDGSVKADVHGRTVVVEGQVEGDLRGKDQIILRHTARVEGSISAPRVTLEDGAVFRGGIEMDGSAKDGKAVVGTPPKTDKKAGDEKEEQAVKGGAAEKEASRSLQA